MRHAVMSVAELLEQCFELDATPMHVADEIEAAGLIPQVVPQAIADDAHRVDLFHRIEDEGALETLFFQSPERAAEFGVLVRHHVLAELPIGALAVARMRGADAQIEHDGHAQRVAIARDGDERTPAALFDVGRVDHGEETSGEPPPQDVVQRPERIGGRGLIVLVVGHEAAEEVRRQDLRRCEVLLREGGLAAARGADQDDERDLGDVELARGHRVNTASWVGAPTVGSTAPMPLRATA